MGQKIFAYLLALIVGGSIAYGVHRLTTQAPEDEAARQAAGEAGAVRDDKAGEKRAREEARRRKRRAEVARRRAHAKRPAKKKAGKACEPYEMRPSQVSGEPHHRILRKTLTLFHSAQGRLMAWVGRQTGGMDQDTRKVLRDRIQAVQFEAPPYKREPDLHYRGVVRFVGGDSPKLRAGFGFFDLVRKQPKRAEFEMVRVLAQAWDPCELSGAGVDRLLWRAAMDCAGMSEKTQCHLWSSSQVGWALGSALGTLVMGHKEAGCTVAGLDEDMLRACFETTRGVAGGGR